MKKQLFAFLAFLLVLILAFSACGLSGGGKENNGENGDPDNGTADTELSKMIDRLPEAAAIEAFWGELEGYWTATNNLFVAFLYENDAPCLTYGIWESESFGMGALTQITAIGTYEVMLTIRFPEVEPDELSEGRPAMDINVYMDLSGLEQDGKIQIKIGRDDWFQYAYGGKTAEEAYAGLY